MSLSPELEKAVGLLTDGWSQTDDDAYVLARAAMLFALEAAQRECHQKQWREAGWQGFAPVESERTGPECAAAIARLAGKAPG